MDMLRDIKPVEEVLPAAPRGMPVPWWAKVGAKIVLSRVLPGYDLRRKVGLFLHGRPDENAARHRDFIVNVMAQHKQVAGARPDTILELGPGDSLGAALFANAAGAERVFLMDVGDFAVSDMAFYRRLAAMIEAQHPGFAARVDFSDRARMLASLNATYLTGGTRSLAAIPDGTLDTILSTAVLEHVARGEFAALAREMMRVLKPGGTCYHEVDLMDHLGGAQNNLRFSETLWESGLMANSGFYTNRLRCSEIVEIAHDAGFEVAVTRVARWPSAPTPRSMLARQFDAFSDDEMLIANFGMLLRKPLVGA